MEYDISELQKIQGKEFDLNEALRDMAYFVLPILSFAVFLGLLFFAIIPSIQGIYDRRAKLETVTLKDKDLKLRISNITELGKNNAKIESTIEKVNTIVPTGRTEVVKFGDRIETNLAANQITSSGRKILEQVLIKNNTTTTATGTTAAVSTAVLAETTLPLAEIPTQFDISGTFLNVRSFFNNLYAGSDFFIVDKMDLSFACENTWTGKVSLVKYQFSPNPSFSAQKAFGTISENAAINQTVIDFLNERFVNSVNDSQTEPTPTPPVVKTN